MYVDCNRSEFGKRRRGIKKDEEDEKESHHTLSFFLRFLGIFFIIHEKAMSNQMKLSRFCFRVTNYSSTSSLYRVS